jgi:hypothetical protein
MANRPLAEPGKGGLFEWIAHRCQDAIRPQEHDYRHCRTAPNRTCTWERRSIPRFVSETPCHEGDSCYPDEKYYENNALEFL